MTIPWLGGWFEAKADTVVEALHAQGVRTECSRVSQYFQVAKLAAFPVVPVHFDKFLVDTEVTVDINAFLKHNRSGGLSLSAEWTEADYRSDIAHVTLDAFGKPTNFKLMTQVRPHPHPGNSSKQQFQA